jgi:hypothetical protein
MQTFKSIFAICAVALLAGSLGLRAADTPAQAKAREALRKKLNELESPLPSTSAPAPAAPVQSASVAVTPATPKPAAAVAAPAAPAVVAPETPAVATQVVAPASSAPEAPAGESFSSVPPPSNNQTTDKAREAVRQKWSELEAQDKASQASPPVAPAPEAKTAVKTQKETTKEPPAAETKKAKPAEKAAEAQAKVKPEQAAAGLQPLMAPPIPISQAKEARLQELLKNYKADQITPEEYHKQRAAILAEP